MIKSRVKILLTDEKGISPFSFGLLQPKIIIPDSLYRKLSQEEVAALIDHEFGHIRWLDIVSNMFIKLISFIFWYIPFIHKYAKQISYTAELACDEATRNKFDLAVLIEKILNSFLITSPALVSNLISSNSEVVRRLKYLLESKKKKSGRLRFITNIVLIAFSIIIISMVLKSRFGII